MAARQDLFWKVTSTAFVPVHGLNVCAPFNARERCGSIKIFFGEKKFEKMKCSDACLRGSTVTTSRIDWQHGDQLTLNKQEILCVFKSQVHCLPHVQICPNKANLFTTAQDISGSK